MKNIRSVYNEKYSEIADADYSPYDPYRYIDADGPISWDDKRPGAYVLIAQITKDETLMKIAYDYCDTILEQPKTAGGCQTARDRADAQHDGPRTTDV